MDHDNDTLGYLTEIEQELSEITKTMDFRTVAPDNLAALEIKCEEISALLIYSTANGLLNLYQLLLKFVGLEMIRDSMGWTPLMQSIRHGHLDVAQCIMEDGGCIRSFNYHGADVMSVAVASGDLNIVKFFLEKINSTQSDNLLGCMSYIATACAYGFADIAKFLLQTHPNEIDDAVEKSEMTPLMLAVAGGHISVVRLLTTCGAELTPKNSMGLSARDIALLANDEKVLSALGVSLPRTPIYSENHFLFPPQQSPLLLKLPVVFHQRKMNSNSNRMPYPMVHNKNQCFSCSSNCHDLLEDEHPLTPNTYISPRNKKRLSSPEQMRKSIKFCSTTEISFSNLMKRSKSLDCILKEQLRNGTNNNLVRIILEENNLSELWTLFESQDITLKTFLTINEEDLEEIGVVDASVRAILLEIINHYRKIFPLNYTI